MPALRISRSLILAALLVSGAARAQKAPAPRPAKAPAYRPLPAADIERRTEALLAQMTLAEKVGQMCQITAEVVGQGPNRYTANDPYVLDQTRLRDALLTYHIGSVINSLGGRATPPAQWAEVVGQMQATVAQDRLKIPLLYGIDAMHGAGYTAGASLFPGQITQAAARNRSLVRRAAEVTAYEVRASSTPWIFAPVLDLGSDPRSPRLWETFGEDPYLIAELGVQAVKGYEGEQNDIGNPLHAAASLKHFVGYQVPQSGHDRTNANISPEALYEYHLPQFEAAIRAGAHTLMLNSGLINGLPVHANKALLTGYLRDKLGFKGVIVTDWQDVENLYSRDHLAASPKEAIMLGINAGIDVSMVPYQYEAFCKGLTELVQEGKVPQSRVDDAVRRVLRLKLELGLFEHAVANPKDYPQFASAESARLGYQMAAEGITLLKNEGGVLPLRKGLKVLVTGPNANSMRPLNGGWSYSWQGDKADLPEYTGKFHTILQAVQAKDGAANVQYVPGVSYRTGAGTKYYDEAPDRLDEAVAAAAGADVVLLCLGENSYVEKPGDLNDLYLSEAQTQLAQRLVATGKPVVLVLTEGRPRLISRFEAGVKGVVQTYLPGNAGGDALADILWGDVNPSGRLPYTYPRYPNALVGYIHKYSEEQKPAAGAYDYGSDYNPQYRFGDGLSYTTFAYSELKVDKANAGFDEAVTVTVQVRNTGPRAGMETVHLYSSDLAASQVAPDMRRLRRFEKVSLQPGETKTVTFVLPLSELAYAGPDGQPVREPGDFELRVGELKQKLTVTGTVAKP